MKGLGYRRGLRFGPFRVNFSKSGIGLSAGIRGFRGGINSQGKQYVAASVPGTGLFYRKVLSGSRDTASGAELADQVPDSAPASAHAPDNDTDENHGQPGRSFAFWPFIGRAALLTVIFCSGYSVYSSLASSGNIRQGLELATVLAIAAASLTPFLAQSGSEEEQTASPEGVTVPIIDANSQAQADAEEKAFEEAQQRGDGQAAYEAYLRIPLEHRDLFEDMHFEELLNTLYEIPEAWDLGIRIASNSDLTQEEGTSECWQALLKSKQGKMEDVHRLLQPYLKSRKVEHLQKRHRIEYVYALCLINAGHTKEALQQLKAANRRRPGYKDIAELIERLQNSTEGGGAPRPPDGSAPATDPYEVLGIARGASRGEIEQAYRSQVVQYHPDKVAALGPELQALANRKTQELNQAYAECLKRLKVHPAR